MPTIVLAADGHHLEKVVSNIEQVAARLGKIIAVVPEELAPKVEPLVQIRSFVRRSQMCICSRSSLSFRCSYLHTIACRRGTDVDQPRNLAKSVTVE